MTDHGPGLTWLAERAGMPPGDLLRDRAALLGALATAGRDAAALAARLGSDDAAVRSRAEIEARAVRARFAGSDESPGERLGRAVAAALRAEAERQRAAMRDTAPPNGTASPSVETA